MQVPAIVRQSGTDALRVAWPTLEFSKCRSSAVVTCRDSQVRVATVVGVLYFTTMLFTLIVTFKSVRMSRLARDPIQPPPKKGSSLSLVSVGDKEASVQHI